MAAAPAAAAAAPAQGQQGAPAANSVAAFLARWEQMAKLSDAQYGRITTLSKLTAERPVPKDFARVEDTPAPAAPSDLGLDGIDKIDNIQQFYEWFASLEQEIAEEKEEKFTTYLEKLCDYRTSCDVMLGEVDRALAFLADLEKSYTIMSTKTGELHQACESLLQEQKRLTQLTDTIKEKLAFYNDMEKITRQFSGSSVPVTDPAFRATLKRLDECVAFVQAHPSAKDQSSHLLKFRQLQNRGLSFLRNYIIQSLTGLTQQVQAKIKTSPVGEPSEGGVLYLTFKTNAPQLKALTAELEKRANLPEYQALLNDCHNAYFNQRRALLLPIVNSSMRKLAASSDLHATVRTGCAYVVNVCCLEHQLFGAFFEKPGTALRDFLGGVSVDLYDTLRPLVIHSHQLDVLCGLVSVIRNQILDDQLEKRGQAVVPFASVIGRLLEDAQERIIFVAQTYIRDEIATFQPSPDDLAYPDKLQRAQGDAGAADSLRVIYATWYPTLQKTIICLSRLSLSLEPNTFSGIASEAVSVCIGTLMTASKGISAQRSVVHGALFLVRHFLILRKEIAPFDVEFRIIEKSLDFSQMTGAISKLLTGRTPLAALYSVVQSTPKVLDSAQDSKKDLDRALLGATEALISLVIKASMEGMVSFVTKASVIKPTPAEPQALRRASFAQAEALKALAQETRAGIDGKLPGMLQLVQLYLANQGGVDLVVSNMRANMVKYLQQAHDLLVGGGYTADELLALGFSIEDLKAQVQVHFIAQAPTASNAALSAPPSPAPPSPAPPSPAPPSPAPTSPAPTTLATT